MEMMCRDVFAKAHRLAPAKREESRRLEVRKKPKVEA
jgi:hypothetical protein